MVAAVAVVFDGEVFINGVGFNMLKDGSKLRRTAGEVKAERLKTKKKEPDVTKKLAELQAFEMHLNQRKDELENGEVKQHAAAILNDLVLLCEVKQHEDGSWDEIRDIELQPL